MKILMTLTLAGGILSLPESSSAWIAYGHAGFGCCYHAGYCCGGVSTGTAVAAGMAGLAVGASIARANQPVVVAPVYTTPYYVAPTYVAPTYVPPPPVVVPPSAPIGSEYYSLPPGVQAANINGVQYYVLGTTYYRPFFGSNGVYYQVVANPI
jgi:hypothetical protein